MTSEVDQLVTELMAMTAPKPRPKKASHSPTEDGPEVLPEHYINGNQRGLDAPAGHEAAKRRAMLLRLIGSNESFQREAIAYSIVIVEQRCACCGATNEYIGSSLIETWAPSRKLRAWVSPSEVPPSDRRNLPIHTKRIQSSVEYCPSCAEDLEFIGESIPWIQADLFIADEATRAGEEAEAARAKVMQKIDRILKEVAK